MVPTKETNHPVQYKLVPPDGGWGHLITVSVSVMNFVTLIPAVAFGLLYGNFLASIGDETTGTALSNGVFNTVQSFTGLLANYLLQNYSFRKIGLIGAGLYIIGAVAMIFITNLAHLVVTFGILQGLGFGLMLPASFSAFNCYFDKRLNLMMGISQTIVALGCMIFPPSVAFLVNHFGFRVTLGLIAALSLLNFPAMAVLQPVEMHMKKVPMKIPNNATTISKKDKGKETLCVKEDMKRITEPLLNESGEEPVIENNVSYENNEKNRDISLKEPNLFKPRHSVISLGKNTASIITVNNCAGGVETNSPVTGMNLSLLKDRKYLNISFGLSLSYTADVLFYPIVPMLLYNAGFATADVALMMMVYFGSDLFLRILLSIVSAVCKIRNRYIFLAGSFCSAIFRTAFVLNDSYLWKMTTLSILGVLRGLIQTPLALVISEEYNSNFPTAFSLFMVVCGLVNLIFGPLLSFVKSYTGSDVMVVHLMSMAFLLCSIPWTIELLWTNFRRKKYGKNIVPEHI